MHNHHKKMFRCLAASTIISGFAMQTMAQQATWSGSNDSWFIGANWSTGIVPDATTEAIINSGVANIDGPGAQASVITLSNVGGLAFSNGTTASNLTINILNRDDNAAGSRLDFLDTSSAGNAVINVSGIGRRLYADFVSYFVGISTAGNASITLSDYSQLIFAVSSTAGFASINSSRSLLAFVENANAGSARITNGGESIIVFGGAATAIGATIVNKASADIDLSGRSGQLGGSGLRVAIGSLSGAGDVFLGSTGVVLGALNRDDTLSGVVQDGMSTKLINYRRVANPNYTPPQLTGGVLEKTGSGTLTLTGENTYTGGTLISQGTLELGRGGTSGSIVGNVQNDGTLAFNRFDDVSFRGVINGSGTIRQIGAGRTELTGDSDAFAGSTFVEAGTLAVNGLLGGVIDVESGGRLQGTGAVGKTTVSGTIDPGNSIGTLTVNGDLRFQPGSTYDVEVDAQGQSDLIHSLGAATINGGTVNVAAAMGDYKTETEYTILTADGGRNGVFSGLSTDLMFLDPSLRYDPLSVYLKLTRNSINFASIGRTPNEMETGRGVESAGKGNPLYDAILNSSAEQARFAFNALSGEIHASVVTGLLEDSWFVRDAMNNRLRTAFERPQIATLPVLGFVEQENIRSIDQLQSPASNGIWGSAFGSWGSIESDGNGEKLSRNISGFVSGLDGPVTDGWRLGVLAGYSHSSFNIDARQSSSSVDSYHFGLYGGTQGGQWSFRSGMAYTWNSIDSRRQVVFAGFNDRLNGGYDAGTAQIFGEFNFNMKKGDLAIEPFANLAYVNVHTNGVAEDGAAAALSVVGRSNALTFSTFGARASSDFLIDYMNVFARGMIGWRHAYGDVVPSLSQAFAGGDEFPIAGVGLARDALVLEAGLDFEVAPSAILGISYHGQLTSNAEDHAVKVQLNFKF